MNMSLTRTSYLIHHIVRWCTATFGQLADDVPAQQALKCQVDTSIGLPASPRSQVWMHRPGLQGTSGWFNSARTPIIPHRAVETHFVEVMVLELHYLLTGYMTLMTMISGFMQLQIHGREITLDGLHPSSTWPPRWTSPALRSRLKNNLAGVCIHIHSRKMSRKKDDET